MIKDNIPMANYTISKVEMAFLDWAFFFLENSIYILNKILTSILICIWASGKIFNVPIAIFGHCFKHKNYAETQFVLLLFYSMSLYYIEQGKLHLPPFDQSTQNPALISAERDILTIVVPISRLYFSQKSALRMLTITKQSPHTHVIGKQGQ